MIYIAIYLPKAGNIATIKKSWKKVGGQAVGGGSCHKSKRSIVGPKGEVGPPPPKQMADLLKLERASVASRQTER